MLEHAALVPADPAQVHHTTQTLRRLLDEWYVAVPVDAPVAS
jgi:hypothetical protein